MQCYLMFADIDAETPIEEFLNDTYGKENYVCFNEVSSKTDKEHIHLCILSDYKKDTIQKQFTKKFPQLKSERKGRGGSHKYSIKLFPQDYNGNNYDEFPQDYIAKDNCLRCGELWSETNSNKYHSSSKDKPLPTKLDYPEWLARNERVTEYLGQKKIDKKSLTVNGKKVPNKESASEKFQKYLNSYLAEDIRYFYEENKPTLDRTKLKEVIIKYYTKYGKPSNRNIIKVIAEQIIFYGHTVCPEDKTAYNTLSDAIDSEINNLTRFI